jgi:NAD(P)-dependent dehydrogenase (short-subunit alcohol dehydrogenase family)
VISPDQRIYLKEGIPESEQFKKPISYSVIKTGLIGMTRYLATYWANSGVRVNAISPGGVFENQDSDFVEKLVSRIPMNRMATPQDYVGVIQFLASDASSYMTGQNMVIDGGRSVW